MSKLPSIQFYPGDWLRDDVAGCSLSAQGLWLRLIIIMHDCDPYGHLVTNGKPMTRETLLKRCGAPNETEFETAWNELVTAGVPRITVDGIWYSNRMVKDARGRKNSSDRVRKHRQLKRDETEMKPYASSSSSSSVVLTNKKVPTKTNSTKTREDPPETPPREPPKSPVWEGCKFFRMSESEKKLAEDWYLKNNFPVELIVFSISVVETWLCGQTKGARDARKSPTHYRQLYAEWVVDKAWSLSGKAKRGSGGGGSSNGNIRNPTITERNQEYFNRKEQELKENDARTNSEIVTVDGECLD